MNHKDCRQKQIKIKGEGHTKHTFNKCLEHGVIFCHCGFEFGQHPVSKGILRNRCVLCWKPIIMSKERYNIYGNYCPRCSTDCDKIASHKKNPYMMKDSWNRERERHYSAWEARVFGDSEVEFFVERSL